MILDVSSIGTVRHTFLALALVVAGCSSSHSGSEPGTDGGSSGSDAGGADAGGGATDGGGSMCGAIDPGLCYGGPCCDDEVIAELDLETCTGYCPEGYDWFGECEPDPAAFCAPDFRSCDAHADCELAINACCWPCGEQELSDFDAINGDYAEEHRATVCDDPTPACPRCATFPNPALGATCGAGLCQGFDVRAMDLSACTTDADCRLRVTECCPCGGDTSPTSLIAVRTDAEADYQALVCDDIACPECEPVYPTDMVEAFCADDGHCDVRMLVGG